MTEESRERGEFVSAKEKPAKIHGDVFRENGKKVSL